MTKQNWDDELEGMMRQLPRIEDQRSKDVVYSRVKQQVQASPKHKRSSSFIPVAATIAAVILLVVIASASFFTWGGDSISLQDSRDESTSSSNNAATENSTLEKGMPESEESRNSVTKFDRESLSDQEDQSFSIMSASSEPSVLFPDEIGEEERAITLAVPDQNAQFVVPFTFVVPREQENSWEEGFQYASRQLNEEALGLSEYYPLEGSFQQTSTNEVQFILDENAPYEDGSTGSTIFLQVLQELFEATNIEIVRLERENGEPVQFQGAVSGSEFSPAANVAKTYYIAKGKDKEYFMPEPSTFGAPPASIEEALERMKLNHEQGFIAPLPEDLEVQLSEQGEDQLVVSFQKQLRDSEKQNRKALFSILLVARSFGYSSVLFEGTGMERVDSYPLTEPVPVPVGENQLP
ncbi:hypothetical protein [Bacillus fonticola]|uniref:hypothetical protein n=1 Tax=Bacillus fonticola TaxID=2728853 RepID=UPI0014755AFE|nr:hypothetical protein [Bacillus fonticola]